MESFIITDTLAKPHHYQWETSREILAKTIGKELTEKYETLLPILTLAEFWCVSFAYASLELIWSFERYPQKETRRRWVSRCANAAVCHLYRLCRRRKFPPILLSDTFLSLKRYPGMKEEIVRRGGYHRFVSIQNFPRLRANIPAWLGECFRFLDGQGTVYIDDGIAGADLHNSFITWTKYYREIAAGEVCCDYETADRMLSQMQALYEKRRRKLVRALKHSGIEIYMTVNDTYLSEVITVAACEELGIRTIRYEHGALQFARSDMSPERPFYYYIFCQEYVLWNEAELRLHEITYKTDNVISSNPIRFRAAGNPELCFREAEELRKKYPVGRRLLFTVNALRPDENEKYIEDAWRWDTLHALKKLADVQNLTVRVRYRPYSDREFRAREIPVLRQWGFEISESVPESLMEDICTSAIVLSSTSSILETAIDLGKRVYRLEEPGMRYLRLRDEVKDITIAQIEKITLPEQFEDAPLDQSLFFDYDRLFFDLGTPIAE